MQRVLSTTLRLALSMAMALAILKILIGMEIVTLLDSDENPIRSGDWGAAFVITFLAFATTYGATYVIRSRFQ